MTKREKSTAIVASVGEAAGAIVTSGGVIGAIGGASIAEEIGNQIGKDKK